MNSPYAPPTARVSDAEPDIGSVEYGGFWARTGAMIIDSLILLVITVPILLWAYGTEYFVSEQAVFLSGWVDFLISYVFPIVATVLFWKYRAATPGKMMLGLKIVREEDLGPLSTGQAIGRYFAYILSTLGLLLGFVWVAFDKKKQGWHDKLAGTVVIRA